MSVQNVVDDDPVAALPPFVSIKRTAEFLGENRSTTWRRIKRGELDQVLTGKISRVSIRRLVQPRAKAGSEQ